MSSVPAFRAAPPSTRALGRADVHVTVARSFEELEALRPRWEELQGTSPHADPDYFAAVVEVRPEVARPHVVAVERDGDVRALAVGRVERATLPARVGYRTLWAPRLRALTVVYGGVLGDVGEEEARLLLGELQGALGRGEADVLRLRNLRLGSPMHRVATETPSPTRQRQPTPSLHWELALPASLDELLRSRRKSVRENYRSGRNRLLREFGDRLAIRAYREPHELDELFEAVRPVALKTYQAGLGAALVGTPLQRRLARLAMERGWFRGYVLTIDGRPVAFWHGNAYRGTFHLDTPGYDPEYRRLGVGSYLLHVLIGDLCEDPTVDTFDFGFGHAEYKQRLASASWEEEDVLFFAPRPRPLAVKVSRSMLLGAADAARTALGRSGALARVKRGWRRQLARSTGA